MGEANVSLDVLAGEVNHDNIDTLLRDQLTLEGRIRPKEVSQAHRLRARHPDQLV